jgi:hypothetical protein
MTDVVKLFRKALSDADSHLDNCQWVLISPIHDRVKMEVGFVHSNGQREQAFVTYMYEMHKGIIVVNKQAHT